MGRARSRPREPAAHPADPEPTGHGPVAKGCMNVIFSRLQSTICNTVSLLLIHSDRFAEHQTPPGHPERPERAEVLDAVAARWRERGTEIVAPRAATTEQLARVHDGEHLRRISETAGKAS